ncbi:hypothetical protein B0H14DRAFT_3787655 [Mycena olivaceomarginata]|nr:hypothetical protein B0H14DRAFT_3787655 [Mycena olivaceomarginata]
MKKALQLELNKVNLDGPSLKFNIGFTVSELPYQEVSGVDLIGMLENTIASVNGRGVKDELQRMYRDSRNNQFSMDALHLWLMHERILLCYQSNDNRARLLNILGDILLKSYQLSGTVDDVNQAVCAYNDAVRDDQGSVIYLADLGTSLRCHFERLGSLLDINQSVEMLEDAVQLTPDGHPDKPSRLNNLGNSLSRRFERLGDLSDINKSVLMFEDAVKLTPDGHPDKPSRPCQHTINAAKQWEKTCPQAWLGLSITDRHHLLSQAGQVVRDAASAAIAAHDYQKAVEWLEQGRSVIWGQFLNLRTPVDQLRKSHPALADQLVSLSKLLETAGARSNAVAVADATKPQSLQSIAEQSHAHNHVL